MSAWTTAVLLCAVQVTVLAIVAWGFYAAFRRRLPAVATVPQAALAGVVLLTLLATVPWRPWSWQLGVLPVRRSVPKQAASSLAEPKQTPLSAASTSRKRSSAPQPSQAQPGPGPIAAPGPQATTEPSSAGKGPSAAAAIPGKPTPVPADPPHRVLPAEDKTSPDELPDAGTALAQGAAGPLSSPPEELPPVERSGRGEHPRPGSLANWEEPVGLPWWAGVDWPAVLAALVLAGGAWGVVRMLLGLWGLALLVRRSRTIEDASLHALAAELAGRLGLRRAVSIRESQELSSAATVGWPQAVLLLPSTWRSWTRKELRAVLAHELAHIRRGDFLRWLGAQLGLVLHYYHPLLHWLAARVRLEQELAADQLAVEVLQDRAGYLDALARLMLDRPVRAVPLAARTFLPNGHSFMRRVEMLRQVRSGRSSRWRRLAAAALVLGVALLASGLQPSEPAVLAQQETAPARQSKQPATGPAQAPAKQPPKQPASAKQPPVRQAPQAAMPPVPKLKDLRGVWKVDTVGMVSDPAKLIFRRGKDDKLPGDYRLAIRPSGGYMLLKEKQLVESGRIKLLAAEPATLAVQLERVPNREQARGMFLLLPGSSPQERWLYLFFQQGQGGGRWAVLLRRSGDLDDLDVKLPSDFPLAGQGVLDALVDLAGMDQPDGAATGVGGVASFGLAGQAAPAPRQLTLSLRTSCRVCHGPGKLAQDRKLSLAYVPRDSLLVVAARMDKLQQLPLGELYARMLKSQAPAALAALELQQIEQVTVVQLGPGRDLSELFRGFSALVLHLRQKISPERANRLAQAVLRNPRQVRLGQTVFWRGQARPAGPLPLECLWRSDQGRVLVLASSQSNLLRVLAAGAKGANEAAWATRNSVGIFMLPYQFTGTSRHMDKQALLDVHYWLAAFDPQEQAGPRRVHLLLYLPVFRLRTLAEHPDYQPLQRVLNRQPFGRAEELVLGLRAHRQTVHFAALLYTHPIHILPHPSPAAPGYEPPRRALEAEKLEQELNKWLAALRTQLSSQRMRVAADASPEALALLQALEELEGVLDNVWVYDSDDSFVVVQGKAPLQSLRQFGTVMLASAQVQARRTHAANNLRQIAIALHNYHSLHRRFPPAVLTHYQGRRLKHPLSWRVALLPYLGHQKLFDQYRLDEPWDSPNNRKVLQQMPPVYRHPLDPPGTTNSAFYVLVGPGTVFEGAQGISVSEIPDGTSHTILVVEARRNVPWTKPEDIPFDPKQPPPKLGGYFPTGANAAFADGSVRFLDRSVDGESLKWLILRNDGKPKP